MKKITLFFFTICLFVAANLTAQSEFITTWKTDNPGTSNSTSITIPTGPDHSYTYNIDWEDDGEIDDFNVTGSITHDYGVAGTYSVAITGDFPHIYFNNNGDKEKILSIDQWGYQPWYSMKNSFYGCTNLVANYTDTADTFFLSDFSFAFANAINFNGDINDWSTNTVTDMSFMFFGATSFNQPLNTWDVSNVTNMSSMFYIASSFNQPLNNWNVGNVTDMSGMFTQSAFNQDISGWNVSSVTTMRSMFSNTSFNQNINGWNVSNLTNLSFMFFYNSSFNQPLNLWNVENVTDMSGMFTGALSFNQDISYWNVTNVTNMSTMFGETSFNLPLNWNMANVTDMSWMFYLSSFNQDISNWSVGNVTNMSNMFYVATSFDQNLGNWDISNVTDMTNMFIGTGLSLSNYDNTLIGWNSLDAGENQIPTNINFNGGTSKYCNGETARDNLTTTHGWTFTDGGLDCSTLGVADFDNQTLALYPNPVNTSFTVKGLDTGVYSLQIVNLQGQVVKKVSNYNNQSVTIDALASGMYFVNINSNLAKHTIKIIKQ